ncbi:MAG: hypothetical protein ACK53K_08055 [Burkholderiales bacterium]
MSQPTRIAAIYTTYYPDDGFRQRIQHVVERCALTVVVDNTPGGHIFESGQTDGSVNCSSARWLTPKINGQWPFE